MRPELQRLADVLESTNLKLQKFEQEKKTLTKELLLARMEKEAILRLFERCEEKAVGTNSPNR